MIGLDEGLPTLNMSKTYLLDFSEVSLNLSKRYIFAMAPDTIDLLSNEYFSFSGENNLLKKMTCSSYACLMSTGIDKVGYNVNDAN